MNLHSLSSSKGATHRRKRLGRGHGSGLGKTSGKGHKGQRARAGHKRKPTFEGGQLRFVQRVPAGAESRGESMGAFLEGDSAGCRLGIRAFGGRARDVGTCTT